ncbi:AMIN domain-containing protein [Microcoleus sp. herbarium7]|uniref:AMIN domain-containing protein n=1 Tax=Microcoleus sp. herbarium7 TaxID=3055435 RepID=UPI002FD2ACEF
MSRVFWVTGSSAMLALLLGGAVGAEEISPLERVCTPGDPPQPPLIRGEQEFKVPLGKGDLGGSESDREVCDRALAPLTTEGTNPEVPLVSNEAVPQHGDLEESKPVERSTITRVGDLSRPATTLEDWRAQVEAATVQVTGVKLDRTDAGLEIVLETAEGKPLQVDATKFRTEGNSLIADIPNTVLALQEGNEFRTDEQFSAGGGISAVSVTQVDAATVRVTVAGRDALPAGEVTLKTGGLAYSLNPAGDEADEEIEIVVTGQQIQQGYRVPNTSVGTRTNTPLRDIPQSIQVVPQEVLRDQNVNRLDEALRNVSGVTTYNGPDASIDTAYNIRGFITSSASGGNFLRNGLREGGDILQEFTPNIERIEALLGPASVLYPTFRRYSIGFNFKRI